MKRSRIGVLFITLDSLFVLMIGLYVASWFGEIELVALHDHNTESKSVRYSLTIDDGLVIVKTKAVDYPTELRIPRPNEWKVFSYYSNGYHFWGNPRVLFHVEYFNGQATNEYGHPYKLFGVAFPGWFIIVGTLVFPVLTIVRILKRRNAKRSGICPHCGYDLRATPNRCPECGTITEARGA